MFTQFQCFVTIFKHNTYTWFEYYFINGLEINRNGLENKRKEWNKLVITLLDKVVTYENKLVTY